MLAETASEGDDIARYFDSFGPNTETLIALTTTVLSIGHSSTGTMDLSQSMSFHNEILLSGLALITFLTHHQHTCIEFPSTLYLHLAF